MNQVPRWVFVIGSVTIFFLLAWYFSNIVAYILVAGILSIIGDPLVNRISKVKIRQWHIPRGLAAIITMCIMSLVSLIFISTFIPLITSQAKTLAAIDVKQVSKALAEPIKAIEDVFAWYNQDESAPTISQEIQNSLKKLISFSSVSNFFNNVLSITGSLVMAFFSISFILFFFLKEEHLFYRIILTLTPTRSEQNMSNALTNIKSLLTRYFIGIIIQISIIITFISIGLYIVGLHNAILIGFFAGIFNIIPYVGPIIGAMIGIILGITSSLPLELYPDMVWLGFKIMIVFGCAQLLDNFILQPVIFSSSVKAHPLEIFIVILAGGSAGGIGGMILAVPAYTVIRAIAKEFFSESKLVKKLTENI